MSQRSILLGVNVDHVATLRQVRAARYPDPVAAALLAERSGADSITIHVREDHRHIQDRDLMVLTDTIQTRINLEMAVTDLMIELAIRARPSDCCLVPESREELTTEGGLDVVGQGDKVSAACRELEEAGIRVSLFVDPELDQLDSSRACGAEVVELHTGAYADAIGEESRARELARIATAAEYGSKLGATRGHQHLFSRAAAHRRSVGTGGRGVPGSLGGPGVGLGFGRSVGGAEGSSAWGRRRT